MEQEISWSRLDRALSFYKKTGFTYIEAPWFVRPEIDWITKPKNKSPLVFGRHGHMVASGEQSFIQMHLDGQLDPKLDYVCLTPCVRDDNNDDLHRSGFMKVELFSSNENRIDFIISSALQFFTSELGPHVEKVYSGGGLDLMVKDNEGNDIELGSYGWRNLSSENGGIISYGTGLAEPRFSKAISHTLSKRFPDL